MLSCPWSSLAPLQCIWLVVPGWACRLKSWQQIARDQGVTPPYLKTPQSLREILVETPPHLASELDMPPSPHRALEGQVSLLEQDQ